MSLLSSLSTPLTFLGSIVYTNEHAYSKTICRITYSKHLHDSLTGPAYFAIAFALYD